VFTPLSIRRGDGGEAVDGLGKAFSRIKETLFSLGEGRFLVSKRGSLAIKETPSSIAINRVLSPIHSEKGGKRGSPSPFKEDRRSI
jgi:hypothetical protein